MNIVLFVEKEIGNCSKQILSQEWKTDAYTLKMCNIYKMPQNANNHWFNINVKIVNYTEIKKVLAAENESES